MFGNWSISRKLIVSFLIVAAIACGIAAAGFFGLNSMMLNTNEISGNRLVSIDNLAVMKEAQTMIKASDRSSLIKNLPDEDVTSQVKHRDDAYKRYSDAWAIYEPLGVTVKEASLLTQYKPQWEAYLAAEKKSWTAMEEWRKASTANSPKAEALYAAAVAESVGDASANMKAAEATLDEILQENRAEADRLDKQSQATYKTVLTLLISIALTGVVIAIGLGIVVTRSISRPLERIVASLSAGSEQVGSASNQVASASQQLAEGASEQAANLEETSSSLEEMTGMTRQNADNSRQADAMARDVRSATERGVTAVGEMNGAITRIKESSDATARIIKTIDEIAFQTNLLALNAAVEAARAGDAGRGFAVVAEEVRSLAQRSAEAAKNTAALIEESQGNAARGVSVSSEMATALEQIASAVDRVTQLVSEIAAASEEQAQGIDQVNIAVAQMDRVTQSNAANAEESASASEELSAQARELGEMVSVLIRTIRGDRVAATSGVGVYAAAHSPGRVISSVHTMAAGVRRHGSSASVRAVDRVVPARAPEEVIPLDDEDLADF